MDERPEVTVTGAPDLLVSDDPPRRRRTWVVLALVAALVAGGLVVADRREDARLDRQEAAALDVALVAFASERRRYDDATDTIEVELTLQLRNDGPRAVTVLRGGLGGYGLEREVELAAGEVAPLPLQRSVRCGQASAEPASQDLELTVRTGAGPRPVRLPVPFELPGGAAQACGFLPLEDAVTVEVVDVTSGRGSFRLALDVRSVANRPLEVVGAVAVEPGIGAALEEAATGPVLLPLPGPGRTSTTRVHVVLTIEDCVAAAGLPGAPASRAVRLVVQEPGGGSARLRVGYDPALLEALLGQAC